MAKTPAFIDTYWRSRGRIYHLFTTFQLTESRYVYTPIVKRNRNITSAIKLLIVNVVSRFATGVYGHLELPGASAARFVPILEEVIAHY